MADRNLPAGYSLRWIDDPNGPPDPDGKPDHALILDASGSRVADAVFFGFSVTVRESARIGVDVSARGDNVGDAFAEFLRRRDAVRVERKAA